MLNEIPSTALTVALFLPNIPEDISKYFSKFVTSIKFLLIMYLLTINTTLVCKMTRFNLN